MKNYRFRIASLVSVLLLTVFSGVASAQTADPEEQQKQLYEAIDKQIEHLESALELEDWQVFKVDSVFTHDYMAMNEELQELQKRKVENADLYYQVQDKWQEKMYNAFEKIFDQEQWDKYLKQGAARAKKSRDKRAATIEKNAAKVKKQ